MSIVLNMVGGSSGGGLLPTDAWVIVHAPTGSTVTMTDGTSTKTKTPADSSESYDEVDVSNYIFDIAPAEFGSWTVTATYQNYSASSTVTINAALTYPVKLSYGYIFISNGVEQGSTDFVVTSTKYGSSSQASLTQQDGYLSAYVFNGYGFYTARVDTSAYSTLYYDAAIVDAPSWLYFGFSSETNWRDNTPTNYVAYKKYTAAYSRKTESIDISSVNGNYYLKFVAWGANGTYFNMYNIWME